MRKRHNPISSRDTPDWKKKIKKNMKAKNIEVKGVGFFQKYHSNL
jgi:hypothetical protein